MDILERIFQRPRGAQLARDMGQWMVVFALIAGFTYLNVSLADEYQFLLIVVPIMVTFFGIGIGYRSAKGYWLGESPQEQAWEQYQQTIDHVERIKGNERAFASGRKLGERLKH